MADHENEPKREISAARLAANRANAARSTGPKTPEGKARAALNGLTHGMRAETLILPGEDPEELQKRLDTWTEELGAATDAERYLVKNAVHASWRIDRCRDSEAAALTAQILEISEGFDDRQAREVTRLVAEFETDAPAAVAALRRSSHGCRWLVAQWSILADRLVDFVSVEPTDRLRAIALMGKRRLDLFGEPDVWRWVSAHVSALLGKDVETEKVAGYLESHRPEAMPRSEFLRRLDVLVVTMPDRKQGHAIAKAIVAGMIAELTERAELLEAREERDQSLRVRAASLDGSPAGAYRLRYEMAHERSLRNALRELRALQASRPEPVEAPSEPRPDAAPSEPKPPAAAAPSELRPAPSEPRETLAGSAPSEPTESVDVPVVAVERMVWRSPITAASFG
jgi:hypothetical protein